MSTISQAMVFFRASARSPHYFLRFEQTEDLLKTPSEGHSAFWGLLGQRTIMPYSTVERVDCMVCEQYNYSHCEQNPRFQRSGQFSLGIEAVIEDVMASWP